MSANTSPTAPGYRSVVSLLTRLNGLITVVVAHLSDAAVNKLKEGCDQLEVIMKRMANGVPIVIDAGRPSPKGMAFVNNTNIKLKKNLLFRIKPTHGGIGIEIKVYEDSKHLGYLFPSNFPTVDLKQLFISASSLRALIDRAQRMDTTPQNMALCHYLEHGCVLSFTGENRLGEIILVCSDGNGGAFPVSFSSDICEAMTEESSAK